MRWMLVMLCISWNVRTGLCFWEQGTTTVEAKIPADDPRTSFFEWEKVEWETWWWIFPTGWAGNHYNERRKTLAFVCGLSMGFVPLTTGILLNRRTLVSSASPIDTYLNRVTESRVWCKGRGGTHNTPFRYRVWRWRRVIPRSVNPEHQVGPRSRFTTRHDVAVITTKDQMYLYSGSLSRYQYAVKGWLTPKQHVIDADDLYMVGSGYMTMEHIKHNYFVKFWDHSWNNIVNCEFYLPKYWGKHICMTHNHPNLAGIQNGGGLIVKGYVMAIGNFEIRYNEDKIGVFTDLRYYVDWIHIMANITYGEYYDYAYQQWGVQLGWLYDGHGVSFFIPVLYIKYDLWPLGK